MIELGTYTNLLSSRGEADKDRIINMQIEHFLRLAPKSAGYEPDCKRNGEPQRFVVDRTQTAYKYDFIAFPGDKIEAGDIIECRGNRFIIAEPPRILNNVILCAKGWLCNLELKWQNGIGDIIRRWCVLDSGVYSTTKTNDDQYSVPDKQFRLYLPFDDDTKKLYVDKRLAVDTRYNSLGEEILECYAITGFNHIARSYGGHLIICELRSSLYNAERDNIQEKICDYIYPASDESSDESKLSVVGRNSIRIGTYRWYSACIDENEELNSDISWRIDDDTKKISCNTDGSRLKVSVPDDTNLIGKTFKIIAESSEHSAEMEVEVTA